MLLWAFLRLWFIAANLAPIPTEPPVLLTDLAGFPPPAQVQDALRHGEQLRSWALMRASIEPHHRGSLSDLLDTLDQHQRPWHLLAEAQSDTSDTPASTRCRLDALRRLRTRLGYQWYGHRWMPSAVPMYLLQQF